MDALDRVVKNSASVKVKVVAQISTQAAVEVAQNKN